MSKLLENFEKKGFFEWIVKFEDIEKFLSFSTNKSMKILVIGCGTSTLSASMSNEHNQNEVVSIDNDLGCILHMQSQHKDDLLLSWYLYDIIEDRGNKQGNVIDCDGYFDMVVDKGTFDAIHVEGVVWPLLDEVRRLLRVGGVYVLCSINSKQLLEQLLSIPDLSFDSELHDLQLSVYNVATVAVSRKLNNEPIDVRSLAAQERLITDEYFQRTDPLLTQAREETVCRLFSEACQAVDSSDLPLSAAYRVLFGGADSEMLCYTVDLFEEDVANFSLLRSGRMSLDEALDFLRTMQ